MPDAVATESGNLDKIQQMLKEYELEDSGFDEQLDMIAPAPKPKPKPESTVPPPPVPPPPVPPPPAPAPEPKPAEKKHSKATIRLAAELGIPAHEIEALDPDVADERVYQLTRSRLTSPASPPPPPAPEPKEEEYDLGIDESEYDEGLVKALKSMGKKFLSENKALKAEIEKMNAEKAQQSQSQAVNAIDDAFAKAGMDSFFGKGGRLALADDSFELMRRQTVLSSLQKKPINDMTLADAIKTRAKELFGVEPQQEKPAGAKQAPPSYTPEQWAAGGVAKPTDREAPEPKGPNRAAKKLAEKMREQGMETDDFLGPEESNLPD